jgi:hypothetical protein
MFRSFDGTGSPPGRYYYRRKLGRAELLRPVAVGAVVGLAVFYLARLVAQRTPLAGEESGTSSHRFRGEPAIAHHRA